MTELTETVHYAAKSATKSLRAGGTTMRIVALRRADGSAVTFVTTTTGKDKPVGGMTETHADFDEARTAMRGLVAKATAMGWKAGESGYKAKPDAFSALPKPTTTKK
jgi:hypothetical protein